MKTILHFSLGEFTFEAQAILDKSPDLVIGDKIYLKNKIKYAAIINKITGPKVAHNLNRSFMTSYSE
jgi:hypothetical protein